MDRFYINQKKATGTPVFTIADLIPIGRDNAISRKRLVQLCLMHELIENSVIDKDRAMRSLIEKDRTDFVILARGHSEGGGYYRPTHEDMLDLRRYIRQEEKKAKSIFKNLKRARALYEDYARGRIGGD